MEPRRPLLCWFVIGATAIGAAQFIWLSTHAWEPTAFLQVGDDSPARAPIERDFPDLARNPRHSHDGKYSYLVARQPAFWRADAETIAGLQDPAYRYSRPLYPVLAGLAGLASPSVALAGLILVQILAGGLCAAALAAFARRHHLPAAFIAFNVANPGLYSSACLLTCDLLAHSLAITAWLFVERGRFRIGIGLFALVLLTKEYYALTPLALAAACAGQRRYALAVALAAIPSLPIALWKLALTAEFGPGHGLSNFTWPGGGIAAACPMWFGGDNWLGLLAIAVVAISLVAAAWPRSPARLRWACAAWGLLGLCASKLVWGDPADLLRAIAPAWWLASWFAFSKGQSTDSGGGCPMSLSAFGHSAYPPR